MLGAVAGVLGTLQAVEVVKELAGSARSLSGTMLLYDAAAASVDRIRLCAAGPPAPAPRALLATAVSGRPPRLTENSRRQSGLRRMSRRRFGLRGRDRLR